MTGSTKYSLGEVLIYTGQTDAQFKHGESYKIENLVSVDFEPDSTVPDTCLFFEDHHFGCYVSWAKDNFISISEFRERRLNKILK